MDRVSTAKVSAVYARALLDSARAKGQVDAARKDMELVRAVFAKTPGIDRLLENPRLERDKKKALLDRAFGPALSPLGQSFLGLLDRKGRLADLGGIAAAFQKLDEESRRVLRAEVTSARPLTEPQLEAIRKRLEAGNPGNTFALEAKLDPSLLAGFRIRQGDQIIDTSVRHKLSQLKRKLVA